MNRLQRSGKGADKAAAPTTKLSRLHKTFLRDGILLVAVAGALGALAYAADDWSGKREEARAQLETKVNGLANDMVTLQNKLKKAEDSLPVYNALTRDFPGAQISLNRELASQVLDEMKENLLLPSLRVTLSPVHEMEGAAFKNRFLVAQACDVSLAIEALSDEHIVALLHEMRNKLPGKLRITHFTITRTGNITSQILANIAQSGKVSLVKSEARLQWMGMKPAAPAPAAGEKKP